MKGPAGTDRVPESRPLSGRSMHRRICSPSWSRWRWAMPDALPLSGV